MSDTRLRVAITTSSFGRVSTEPLEKLESAGIEVAMNPHGRKTTAEELVKLAKGCQGIIAGTETYDESIFETLADLEVVSRVGVGLDSIDETAAERRGVAILNTPGTHIDSVAEIALAGILDLKRRLAFCDRLVRLKRWDKQIGSLLRGSIVGIIGTGHVGRRLVELLQPFRCEFRFFDAVQDPHFAADSGGAYCDLATLLSASEIVTVHLPLNEETRNLIGPKEFELLQPNAILVNTSRGGLLDEAGLLEWLRANPQASAYIDTFESEPYDGLLADLDNVLLSPHVGGQTSQGRMAMECGAVENLLKHFSLARV
ncbi:MAG: phosphoglycerate dehydrogenase [Planctomycetota bacterium]